MRRSTEFPRSAALALLVALAVVIAGCGGGSAPAPTPTSTGSGTGSTSKKTSYPVTIRNCGNTLTINKPPQRVAAGAGGLAEVLAALGVADKIVGLFIPPEQFGPLNPAHSGEDYLDQLKSIKVLNPGGQQDLSAETVLAARPDFVYSVGFGSFEGGPSETQYERARITVFQYSFYCGKPEDQSIEQELGDIRDLGIIFDVQDRADALINKIRGQIDTVQKAIAGRKPVKTIYWDADSTWEGNPFLVPCCLYSDVVKQAGGELLFKDYTYDRPISKEEIAASDVEAMVAIAGANFTKDLPRMENLIADTPAGRSGRPIAPIPNFYTMPIRYGDHVQAIARALHPEVFP